MKNAPQLRPQPTLIKEVCVENLSQAIAAAQNGADRLELCARLDVGGISPDPDLIRAVHEAVEIPVKVMIRPRAGSFTYSPAELDRMLDTIRFCQSIGVPEIVTGVLHQTTNRIDMASMYLLAQAADPLPITFHKAIDACQDMLGELERLSEIPQVRSILSSGGAATALEGKDVLQRMQARFGQRFIIIAAGKITSTNWDQVHAALGLREYHGRRIIPLATTNVRE